MPRRTYFLMTLGLALSACGLLDPQAQQGMLYGTEAVQLPQPTLAATARRDAGVMMIQRGVQEPDPTKADRFIAIGERLLQ